MEKEEIVFLLIKYRFKNYAYKWKFVHDLKIKLIFLNAVKHSPLKIKKSHINALIETKNRTEANLSRMC